MVHLPAQSGGGALDRVAEFSVTNPWRTLSSAWRAQALPTTQRTNDLELTLLKLTTGQTGQESGTRAEFVMKEAGEPTSFWAVTRIAIRSPWGEYPHGALGRNWSNFVQLVDLPGALWLDEPAWRLRVEISRWINFRPWETWIIKGVPVPEPGRLIEMRAVTNMCALEIEFMGVSGANAALGEAFTAVGNCANVHVRSPYPVTDVHIILADVVDDRGRHALRPASSATLSAGGGGITLKELLQGFAISIPEGAKTLDVTFAVTKSQYFEFFAKPVMAETKKRL